MNNLEPVNSRNTSPSPRAKIGDVVIIGVYKVGVMVRKVNEQKDLSLLYKSYDRIKFINKDILKNLTTNVSYE